MAGEPRQGIDTPTASGDEENDDSGSHTVLLVGHGSRRERSNEQVRVLAAALNDAIETRVEYAFLELATPAISDAIADLVADGMSTLTLQPLSLVAASHVKNDLPLAAEAARKTHPDLTISVGRHLGVHPGLIDLLETRVTEQTGSIAAEESVAVVLCARGSSDPAANATIYSLARHLYEGRPYDRVEPTFEGVTDPQLPETLHDIAKQRPDRAVVLPYMFGPGVLTERIQSKATDVDEQYPYLDVTVGGPLGTHEDLVSVLVDRIAEARRGEIAMSCDTCKYRVALSGFEQDVDGVRDLRRALLHRAEHADRTDVDDQPHVHDAPESHVAVCTNRTCSEDGAPAVLESLRQQARDRDCKVRITETSCLGQCGEGPIVAIYPDGVWYGCVDQTDAARIVEDHLGDRQILADLVHETL